MPDIEPDDIIVSATKTRNYLLKDPLIDWLAAKPPGTQGTLGGSGTSGTSGGFTTFIMQQGNIFENNVTNLLIRRFGPRNFITLTNRHLNLEQRYQETLNAMSNLVPFILQGTLYDAEHKICGIPDILIRGDWLRKLYAQALPDPNLNFGANIYYVIEIKYATLTMRADGIHLLNSGSMPAYKGQLWMYNVLLGNTNKQVRPSCAFVLGRRWKYTQNGQTYFGNNCFDKLGRVDFSGSDIEYIDKTFDAVQWLRDLAKHGNTWNITPSLPLPRAELYPNMSNHMDSPWHAIKKEIADEIKEITSLWMCGPRERQLAHAAGVYKWTDPECTPEILGIRGEKTANILNQIISVNRSPPECGYLPNKIETNLFDWKNSANKKEFFIDFETVSDLTSGFAQMPRSPSYNFIAFIGVGNITEEGNWEFKYFNIEEISERAENRILTEFKKYIREQSKDLIPCLYHWSGVENIMWNQRMANIVNCNWIDLLEIFKNEPICIQGAMSFGLKDIARALYKLGYIQTVWGDSSITDGADAMIALQRAIVEKNINLWNQIIRYNEIDCRVLQEILYFIRTYLGNV